MADNVVGEITAALMAAYADQLYDMKRTEQKKAKDIARQAFQASFKSSSEQERERFINRYVTIYEGTWDLLEQGKPEFTGLLKFLRGEGYHEQYEIVGRFADQLVYTAHIPEYFPGVTYPGVACEEIVLSAIFYLFCGNCIYNLHPTDEADLIDYLIERSKILYLVDREDIPDLLEKSLFLYRLLIELLQTHQLEVEAMTEIVMEEKQVVRQAIGRGMAFLQEFILPRLPEERVAQLVRAFGLAFHVERGILPAGSHRRAYCIAEDCKNAPDRVGSITLHLEETGVYELSLFSCPQHVSLLKKTISKQRIEEISRSLKNQSNEKEIKPPKVSWFSTREEIRQIVLKQKYLIDRYRIQQREEQTDLRDESIKIAGERGRAFFNAFVDNYVDLAKKYEMPDAPTALLATLPPPKLAGMAEYLGEPSTWIRLHHPIETAFGNMHGFSFGVPNDLMFEDALKRYPLSKRQAAEMYEVQVGRVNHPEATPFGLDIINDMGECIWSAVGFCLYLPSGKRKVHVIRHEKYVVCGNPACKEREDSEPCEKCIASIEEQLGYFVNALRIIKREFAPELQQPLEKKTITTIRKEPNPERLHKFVERSHTDDIYVVRMPGLKLRPRRDTRYTRGSWLERLEDGQVIHVSENIDLFTRTLRSGRFRPIFNRHGLDPDDPEFEGLEITVKGHPRGVPMKIETLKKRIQLVD